jgi:ribosomal protein S18 acetylase RimI-like enzyme
MDLKPFDPAYAAVVASWGGSPDEVLMWCGLREYPVPASAVLGWQADDVAGYLLFADGKPVGYGELWFDEEDDEIELARIIVTPAVRGRGIGQVLVHHLTEAALATDYSDIFMRVHPDNTAALRCYQRASFTPVDPARATSWNAEQPLAYVWLKHSSADRM